MSRKIVRKKNLEDELGESRDYRATATKIEWSHSQENYEIESLYDIENNSELIRIEMNTIEFPLFTKNRRIGKNNIMTYEFNHRKNQYLKVTPLAEYRIPGEFEEKIFFALMKLYKKKGHNQTLYTDFSTLISELKIDYTGRTLKDIRKSLKILSSTTYEFNNLFYSNEKAGILNDNMSTTMFSIRTIEFKEAREITNPEILKAFRNSKIKEIIQIKFSGHFYENVIRKGYLYFDRQDLLQIESPVSRTLFMMLTKWRNKDLYVKRYSKFLASRIPLSWKKSNQTGSLSILNQAFQELKSNNIIKNFKFNSEGGRENSYFEIWFDKEHNRNYIQIPSLLEKQTFQEQEDYEITNQLKENLLDDMSSDMPIIESETTKQLKELLNLMPEKARTLKTLEGKIEKALKKKGYEYTKAAVLYTGQNAKASYGKYFDGTISENWHEEFMVNLKEEAKKASKMEVKKIEKEKEKEKLALEIGNKLENGNKLFKRFEALPKEEREKIEEIVYNEYIGQAGVGSSKITKMAYERARKSLIAKHLETVNYFKDKKIELERETIEAVEVFEIPKPKIEKVKKETENTVKIEKEYIDLLAFKFEAFGYLEKKLNMETLKRIMSFLSIESYFKTDIDGYKIELKFSKEGKSLISIEKMD